MQCNQYFETTESGSIEIDLVKNSIGLNDVFLLYNFNMCKRCLAQIPCYRRPLFIILSIISTLKEFQIFKNHTMIKAKANVNNNLIYKYNNLIYYNFKMKYGTTVVKYTLKRTWSDYTSTIMLN